MSLVRRALGVLAVGAVLATGLPAAYAAADAPTTVVVALRPADARALARAGGYGTRTPFAARRAALAASRPANTTSTSVLDALRRNGFRVTARSGWTVTATGSASRTAALRAAVGTDALAVSTPDAAHPWRHHAVPAGYTSADLRAAYDVTRPGSDGAGLTIATVQFSGWHQSDLDTYSTAAGLPLVAPPVQTAVDGANPADTSGGGQFEVALDQEMLLAAAPQAKQRLYFAPNGGLANAVDLYAKIADDVEAGLVQVVSTSWGMCEPAAALDPSSRIALETQLARIVAGGATVFAASGDLGAYDCSTEASPSTSLAVDYPAASPWVVAVGGTSLTHPGPWAETAWTDTNSASGSFAGYASGGGQSTSVARPSWQSTLSLSGTHRLVPDVAAMADPNHGFGIYTAADGWQLGGGTSAAAPLLAGHLASALSSAGRTTGVGDIHPTLYNHPELFRDVTSGSNLSDSAGVGYDLVTGLGTPQWSVLASALFGDPVVVAPAAVRTTTVPVTVTPPTGMTVTNWSWGEGTTVACDAGGPASPPSSITLAAGADRLTHLAVAALDDTSGCHVGTATVRLDTTLPAAAIGAASLTGTDERTRFSWFGSDTGSGVASYRVSIALVGSGGVWSATTTSRAVTLTLKPGWTYRASAYATDLAGNVGPTVTTYYAVPVDDANLRRSSGWRRYYGHSMWKGGNSGASRKGSALWFAAKGKRFDLILTLAPNCGWVDVYVDGKRLHRFSTYAASTSYRRVVTVASYGSVGTHTVKVVVLGSKSAASRGTAVYVDAYRVTR